MIEAYIHERGVAYNTRRHTGPGVDALNRAATEAAHNAAREVRNQDAASVARKASTAHTPPMLPSPAVTASSSTSTPIAREGTPHTNGSPASNATAGSVPNMQLLQNATPTNFVPSEMLRNFPQSNEASAPTTAMLVAASKTNVPAGLHLVAHLKSVSEGVLNGAHCQNEAVQKLNLPVLATQFPNTFARMMYSSLGPEEEYEPDIEDTEGELFWPGQCARGEGLGWLCLMGRAMINEFGKPLGYKGLAGVVPKP